MAKLQAFMADPVANATLQHRVADFGSAQPKGNYLAVAFVVAGMLPEPYTTTYTIGQAAAAQITGSNIVAALKDLAYKGMCWFLGDGLVNGKAGKPTEMKNSTGYGSRTAPRTTGEVAEKVDFTVKDTFLNTDFWNSLRAGLLGPLDVYLFTNRTVQVVRYASEMPTFDGIGYEMPGDYNQDIPGGFSVAWTCERGQLSPLKGVKEFDLNFELLRYSFAAATPAPTNLTLVAGTSNRYTMTTGTAAKIKRAVVEAGAVRYSIYKNTNEDIPATELVTIDSDTGEVTLAAGMPVGRYFYTVAAENTVGVYGSYQIEIVVK
ncbi:hypothetical protein [Spirosoma oryzicola]|uniref:hypothetical protein n=1 Tax=Spirosoma oryzicola TaxID=2898794 RepID=UPI001E419774|nr:hypothetical protein [Spirosoma oryzicola]UHG91766.1 hypothetical protein LQ777_02440 [Spirosoma oryzicola]